MLILFLAANTSYNAFPRLAAILAEDGYMPRQFAFRGDRLAYSWGIVLLAGVAIALLVAFGGTTTLLIPLYSVGVFVCFTLSQTGMVRHWLRTREAGWQWRLGVNAFGAVLTAVVLVIVFVREVHRWRLSRGHPHPGPRRHHAVHPSPIPGLAPAAGDPAGRGHPGAAPRGARDHPGRGPRSGGRPGHQRRPLDQPTMCAPCSSPTSPSAAAAVRARWEHQVPGVPLVIVESPYRALIGPLLAYLDVLDAAWPPDKEDPITFVVVPEYVARSWWERILYNQSAKRLRTILLGRPNTVVVNVPYRREEPGRFEQAPEIAAARDA